MIQILIVDSHPIVRAGLELYLNSKPDLKVVGSLGSGIEIFDFIRKQKVDVIISEIDLPELNGIVYLYAGTVVFRYCVPVNAAMYVRHLGAPIDKQNC